MNISSRIDLHKAESYLSLENWDKIMVICSRLDVTYQELTTKQLHKIETKRIYAAKYLCAYYLGNVSAMPPYKIRHLLQVTYKSSKSIVCRLFKNIILYKFYEKHIQPIPFCTSLQIRDALEYLWYPITEP